MQKNLVKKIIKPSLSSQKFNGNVFILPVSAVIEPSQNQELEKEPKIINPTFSQKTGPSVEELEQRAAELKESKKALMNILEDVEEARMRAEEERNKTVSLINSFSDGVLFFDNQKTLSLINPQAEVFLSASKSEIIGQTVAKLNSQEKFKAIFDLTGLDMQNTINRKEVSLSEKIILEATTILVEVEGQKLGVLIILHDVTREKMVEKMKTEFVSIVAHQLRTPLSAIKWILKMFLDGDMGAITATQTEFLEKSFNRNEYVINLVNDLLNIAKLEEGRFLQAMEEQSAIDIVMEATQELKEMAKEKGLKFEVVLPKEKLPNVLVDKEKIILSIKNIIENAVHYTKVGRVVVALEFSPNKKRFTFKVQDTSIGIPEDQQPRIFTKFFRSDIALTTETDGNGLGLFIAKNIIEAHGGKIWFESQEGRGATFYFTLPAVEKKLFK